MFHTEHQMITHDEFINNLTEDEKKYLKSYLGSS